MKDFLLVLTLSLFTCTAIMAQDGFRIEPPVVNATFDASTFDPVGKSIAINTRADSLILFWRFEKLKGPFAWEPYFCDKNLCYGSDVTECPPDEPVRLGPGDTTNLDLHIYQTSFIECGMFIVTVWERDNPDNMVEIPYNFNCASSTKHIALQNLQLIPNPARHNFELSEEVTDTYMTITNVLGIAVRQLRIDQSGSYSVEGLPSGMYTVNIFSNEGDHLKSVRLKKQ